MGIYLNSEYFKATNMRRSDYCTSDKQTMKQITITAFRETMYAELNRIEEQYEVWYTDPVAWDNQDTVLGTGDIDTIIDSDHDYYMWKGIIYRVGSDNSLHVSIGMPPVKNNMAPADVRLTRFRRPRFCKFFVMANLVHLNLCSS